MTTEFSNIKKKASVFRKNEEYDAALTLYTEMWTKYPSLCDSWDIWAYAKCLRKTNKNKEALYICRKLYCKDKNFQAGNNLYAWCIYEDTIKKSTEEIQKDEKSFFKAANAITRIVSQNENSPYSKTILKVCDYISRPNTIYPAKDVLIWLDRLSKDKLSSNEYRFKDKNNKIVSIASEQERYYAHLTKALEKSKKHQDCIDACNIALKEIDKFHYNNDIWLQRRLAISLGELGKIQDAIDLVTKILKTKQDWFIQFDISKLYFQIQEYDKSLDFGIKACLNHGRKDSKWNLYLFIASLFEIKNKLELAKKHVLYAYLLREQNSWSIPSELQEKINSLEIDLNQEYDLRKLSKELLNSWKEYLVKDTNYLDGTIKTILPHGKAGFIVEKISTKNYYFTLKDIASKKQPIKIGKCVKFLLKDGFDKKKNERTKNAFEIHIL